ncbi:MAG: hypothetical protein V2A79_10655 [Planctomycetota bacterium]
MNPTGEQGRTPRFARVSIGLSVAFLVGVSIDHQAQEAIEAGFGGELEAGRIEGHAVNIEEPGSEHFEHDFGLDRQALVLVEVGR